MIEETVILTKSPSGAGLTRVEREPMMKNAARRSLFAFRGYESVSSEICEQPIGNSQRRSYETCLPRLLFRHQRRYVSRRAGGCGSVSEAARGDRYCSLARSA